MKVVGECKLECEARVACIMEAEPQTMSRLKGKVAIITGGASGLGAATCKLFVEHGAYVIIGDIQDQLGTNLAHQLGSNATYHHCDVSSEVEMEALVACAITKYGCLDIMFCNAGMSTTSNVAASFCDMDLQDFQLTMDVNVKGVLLGIKHGARAMRGITNGSKPKMGGSIICTASTVAVLACGHSHAYTISKHAVVGAMRSAASELSTYGIRVNAISPFVVDTPLAALVINQIKQDVVLSKSFPTSSPMKGAQLKADEIAHAALFLASNDSRFINGQNLVVDGGHTITKKT